jgi:hypothetical protein
MNGSCFKFFQDNWAAKLPWAKVVVGSSLDVKIFVTNYAKCQLTLGKK